MRRYETYSVYVRDQRQALPEHQEWVDVGCEWSPTCLACPLPKCVEEVEPRVQRASIKAEVINALFAEGLHPDAIVERTGFSRRTVYRLRSK